jgi:hypothetical protein
LRSGHHKDALERVDSNVKEKLEEWVALTQTAAMLNRIAREPLRRIREVEVESRAVI